MSTAMWRVLGVVMLPFRLWQWTRLRYSWNWTFDCGPEPFSRRLEHAWCMWRARYWWAWDEETRA